MVPREPVAAPRVDGTALNGGTRVAHQANQEMYIVQGQQAKAEDLVRRIEVPEVRAAEPRAGGAVAALVQWPLVRAELGALDVEASVARERGAVAPHARGSHTIEQIDAAHHAFHEILREPNAHEIARAVSRQLAVDDLEYSVHVGLRFADRQTADTVPDPVALRANRTRGLHAQR